MGSPKYLPYLLLYKKTSQDKIIVFQGSHATLKIIFFHKQKTKFKKFLRQKYKYLLDECRRRK